MAAPELNPIRDSTRGIWRIIPRWRRQKISRVSRSEVRDRISWIEFHYLVGESSEIRHSKEVHELGLFTEAEMMEALREAGFHEVEFDPDGLTGRGLYIARVNHDG